MGFHEGQPRRMRSVLHGMRERRFTGEPPEIPFFLHRDLRGMAVLKPLI
jgi:hypothetical protein